MDIELLEGTNVNLPQWGLVYVIFLFLLVGVFSYVFIRVYMRSFSKNKALFFFPEMITTFGVWISLLILYITPFDALFVAYRKFSNGSFKDWAFPYYKKTTYSFMDLYITFFFLVIFFLFFLLPFVYFSYMKKKVYTQALRSILVNLLYAIYCSFFASMFMVIGLYLPYHGYTENYRHSEHEEERENIISKPELMHTQDFLDGFEFMIFVLMAIGSLMFTVYGSIGISAYPIEVFRRWRKFSAGVEIIEKKQNALRQKITKCHTKVNIKFERRGSQIPPDHLRKLSRYRNEEAVLANLIFEIRSSYSSWGSMKLIVKVYNVLLGGLCIAASIVIWVSLFMSNYKIAKYSAGYNDSHLFIKWKTPTVLDDIIISTQNGLCFDHFLFFLLMLYLTACTFVGIQYLGVCVGKNYRIHPHFTNAQGLVKLSATMICTILFMNFLIFQMLPQYSTFGKQKYINRNIKGKKVTVERCDLQAPRSECQVTRTSFYIHVYIHRNPIFLAFFYWMIWIFLCLSIPAIFLVLFKQGPLIGHIQEVKETASSDESDDEEDYDDESGYIVNRSATKLDLDLKMVQW